jgi:type I restriction enzyme R subunit
LIANSNLLLRFRSDLCRPVKKRNVTQSKAFSERLEAAIARYHTNAITTAQVLEELIQLAKDIRAARARRRNGPERRRNRLLRRAGRERERAAGDGRTDTAVDRQELVTVIKANDTVDWMHRDSARANLRKYGYPPDLQDAAVQNVLQQAEALSAEWAA